MLRFGTFILSLAAVASVLSLSACVGPVPTSVAVLAPTEPPTVTPLVIVIQPYVTPPTETPIATPTISTVEPTLTETAELTATVELTATPTLGPTRVPVTPAPASVANFPTLDTAHLPQVNVSSCSEIWTAGYYRLTNNIKTPGTDCFYVQSNNVVFDCDNHTIEGNNYQGYAFFARKFGFPFQQTPTNVEIRNCRVLHHRTGIFVGGGNNVFIHNNDLSDNLDDTNKQRFGVFLGQSEGGGLRLDTVSAGRVENNTANNGAIGFDLRDSDHVIVRNNTAINNSAWGINLIHTSSSEISGNTVRDNIRYCAWGNGTVGRGCDAGGIILQDGSSHNVVRNNMVAGDNGNGIFIKAHFTRCDDDNLIQSNKILNAVYNGIELGFCTNNRAIGNEITGSMDGILFGFDSNTLIRGNVISNMTNHGISSWNTRNATIDGNQIANSREAVFLYWDRWDAKQFSFLPSSPDNYASRDNVISNNNLHDNTVAGVHLSNSIQNRVFNNSFANNGRNIWLEGKADGNVIPVLTPVPPTNTPAPTATSGPTHTPGPITITPVPSPTLNLFGPARSTPTPIDRRSKPK